MPASVPIGVSVSPVNPNRVYALVENEKGGLFRSDDAGKTWKKINDLVPRPFYYGQIRIDPTDDQRVYVLGVAFFLARRLGTIVPRAGGIDQERLKVGGLGGVRVDDAGIEE